MSIDDTSVLTVLDKTTDRSGTTSEVLKPGQRMAEIHPQNLTTSSSTFLSSTYLRQESKKADIAHLLHVLLGSGLGAAARAPGGNHVALVPALLPPVVQVQVHPLHVGTHEVQLGGSRRRG